MALTDDEREFWKQQADAGVPAAQIAERIKSMRAEGEGAPPRTFANTGPNVAGHLRRESKALGEAGNPVDTFLRNASNAVSSNFVNPLSAKIASKISGQPYDDALKDINETDARMTAANPKSALAGKIVGTGLQLAAPVPKLGAGAGLGARTAHSAAVGAGYGFLGSAGETANEGGTVGESLASGARGATVGGATGGALGYGLGKLFRGAPERVDERIIRDIQRGEGGGKASKKLSDKVAKLAEKPGKRAAEVAEDTGGVPEAVGGAETVRMAKPNFTPESPGPSLRPEDGYRPLGEGVVTPTSENATVRLRPGEAPVSRVGEAPPEGEGSNQVLAALDAVPGAKKAMATQAGSDPGKAARVIQDALEKNNEKTLKPIYAAIDAGPARPEAIEVKLRLQDTADKLRKSGAAQSADYVDRYIHFLDRNYADGDRFTGTMLKKLRNDVGAGNAFPAAEHASTQPGVAAKQAIYGAINDTIEKAAEATPGVDVAALRAGNKHAATLIPVAQALADRAAKQKGGASNLTHAIAGGVGMYEVAHIAAHGMSTGNIAKAATEIAAIYAARHVPSVIDKAGRRVDYLIAEAERAARAGGAGPKMIREIGEAIAARAGRNGDEGQAQRRRRGGK